MQTTLFSDRDSGWNMRSVLDGLRIPQVGMAVEDGPVSDGSTPDRSRTKQDSLVLIKSVLSAWILDHNRWIGGRYRKIARRLGPSRETAAPRVYVVVGLTDRTLPGCNFLLFRRVKMGLDDSQPRQYLGPVEQILDSPRDLGPAAAAPTRKGPTSSRGP